MIALLFDSMFRRGGSIKSFAFAEENDKRRVTCSERYECALPASSRREGMANNTQAQHLLPLVVDMHRLQAKRMRHRSQMTFQSPRLHSLPISIANERMEDEKGTKEMRMFDNAT